MKENNNTIVVVAIVALLVGGMIGYWFGTSQQMPMSSQADMSDTNTNNMMSSSDTHRMQDGSHMHHDDMAMGHMDMMVTSERAFIEGMIPHHQEAVDTAKEVLERGATTAEMQSLAEDIIQAQETEIADMKRWYQAWYGEVYVDTNENTPMMRELSQLSGVALDRTFLEDMVMHHMGAIMMAQSVQPYVEHQEMRDLTKAVVETQSEEIQKMQRMLREL